MHTIADVATQFLDRHDVAHLLGCNPSSVDRLWRAGKLPRPMKIAERILRWDRAELLAALKQTARPVGDGE